MRMYPFEVDQKDNYSFLYRIKKTNLTNEIIKNRRTIDAAFMET